MGREEQDHLAPSLFWILSEFLLNILGESLNKTRV
jgi:hypothetical protein